MSDDPYSYGDYAYDQTPLIFPDDTSGLPELDPGMLDFLAGFQWPTSNKGVANPYNLQTQNLFQNAYQDRLQTIFDMGNAMMTGGLAPGAFAPVVNEKQLDFPITGTLMMQAQGSGLESLLAQYTLEGLSPSQAMLRIRRAVEAAPDDDLEMQDLKAVLPRLPPNQYTPNQPGEIDWEGVTKLASKLGDPYLQEQGIMARAELPNSGVIERNGKFFQTTETPSAATQWLQTRGFDNPYTQYDTDYVRQNNPEFAGIEQALKANFGNLLNERGTYVTNEAERQRQAALRDKFLSQDRAAMERFAAGTRQGLNDYMRAINAPGTHTVTPPEMIGADPFLVQTGPGGITIGGAGRESRTTPGRMLEMQTLENSPPWQVAEGRTLPTVERDVAITPTLPTLPTLSAYSDPDRVDLGSMISNILGEKMPVMGGLANRNRRRAEEAGRVLPKAVGSTRQQDANRRAQAYADTHAAQLAYAQAMLPAYLAAKAGRTPFQDQVRARAQSMYGVGAMG